MMLTPPLPRRVDLCDPTTAVAATLGRRPAGALLAATAATIAAIVLVSAAGGASSPPIELGPPNWRAVAAQPAPGPIDTACGAVGFGEPSS